MDRKQLKLDAEYAAIKFNKSGEESDCPMLGEYDIAYWNRIFDLKLSSLRDDEIRIKSLTRKVNSFMGGTNISRYFNDRQYNSIKEAFVLFAFRMGMK